MADTAKNWPIERAPKLVRLLGDKLKKPEAAEHIIEFPGGAIEVARCTDGTYWAHIIVFDDRWRGDGSHVSGEVIGSRITREGEPEPVVDIERQHAVRQIAVLIRPSAGCG